MIERSKKTQGPNKAPKEKDVSREIEDILDPFNESL